MIRTSTSTALSSPSARTRRLSRNRSRLDCDSNGISPISSRNSVPPAAVSISPGLDSVALVKAPRRCPNSSDWISAGGMAAQLRLTSGSPARAEPAWMALATSSLPVPVGPMISKLASVAATRSMASYSERITSLVPTMP